MSTTKFRTSNYKIEAMTVLKETDKFVTFDDPFWKRELREAKSGAFHQWHDTWEDAHAYLLASAQLAIENAKERAAKCEKIFSRLSAMQPPKRNAP